MCGHLSVLAGQAVSNLSIRKYQLENVWINFREVARSESTGIE